MRLTLALAFLAACALVSATLNPAHSNTKGKCPGPFFKCNETITVSQHIQAAECSHNTRTHKKQTFAVFVTDHKFDGIHGHPYGKCSAYTCKAPTSGQMVKNHDCWTFFWNGNGEKKTNGTECIRDPGTGQCGCEDSVYGHFTAGKIDCT